MNDEADYTIDVVKRADGAPGWIEHWYIPQPMPWATYRVIRDAWNADYTIRSIYEIELAS